MKNVVLMFHVVIYLRKMEEEIAWYPCVVVLLCNNNKQVKYCYNESNIYCYYIVFKNTSCNLFSLVSITFRGIKMTKYRTFYQRFISQ